MSKGKYRLVQANKRHRDILSTVKNELDVQYARIRTAGRRMVSTRRSIVISMVTSKTVSVRCCWSTTTQKKRFLSY